MKLHLTEAQLLQEWRLRAFPEPVREGCDFTVDYGLDITSLLRARMLDWYHRLLVEAPVELLAPVELTAALTVDDEGVGHCELPESVVRVLAVAAGGVRAVMTAPRSRLERLQRSPFVRAGSDSPVAVVDHRSITLYVPAPETDTLTVTAVTDDATVFHIDAAALAQIKPWDNILPSKT